MKQRKDVRENNPSYHEKYLKPFLILYMVMTLWNYICSVSVMLVYHHDCLSDKESPSLTSFQIKKAVIIRYSSLIPFIQPNTQKPCSSFSIKMVAQTIIMFLNRHFLYRLMYRIKVYTIVYFRLSKEPISLLQDSEREETLHSSQSYF